MKKFLMVLAALALVLAGCSESGGGGGGSSFSEVQPFTFDQAQDYTGTGDVPETETEGDTVMEVVSAIDGALGLERSGATGGGLSRAVEQINNEYNLFDEGVGSGIVTETGTSIIPDPDSASIVVESDLLYTYTDCQLNDYPGYTINGSERFKTRTDTTYVLTEESMMINMAVIASQSAVYSVSGDLFACKIVMDSYYEITLSIDFADLFSGTPAINYGTVRGSVIYYDNEGNEFLTQTFDESDIVPPEINFEMDP